MTSLNSSPDPLNEQVSPKWWKPTQAMIAYTVGLVLGTAAFMNQLIVAPIKEISDKRKDDIERLEKELTTAKGKAGDVQIQKAPSGQNQSSQLDLLSTLSINRVYHNFDAKSVASGLILSESAKDQLRKFPIRTVALNIEFQPGQDSVIFWIFDERRNGSQKPLLKTEGRRNSENPNERYFEIAAGSFSKLDPASISEIIIEFHGLKKNKNSASSFAIKSLILK